MNATRHILGWTLLLAVCYGCSSIRVIITPPLPGLSATADNLRSTPTGTASATQQPVHTQINSATSTPTSVEAGRIYVVSHPNYQALEISNLTTEPLVKTRAIKAPLGSQADIKRGVGEALVSTFSHFSNMIAYWVQSNSGELWISDTELKSPQRIFVDSTGEYVGQFAIPYGATRLLWSADDNYLIVEAQEIRKQSLIYSIKNRKLEPWPWSCNLVAVSPRTGRLSTWCSSTEGRSGFSVIEWGGDIWYSDESPNQTAVKRSADMNYSWGWSSDGNKIAYFDPQDENGRLFVADASGPKLAILPGIAWMGPVTSYSFDFFSRYPIQWSRDGNRLLVYGQGDECPKQENLATGELQKRPCWQVIDANKGEVLWRTNKIASVWPNEDLRDARIDVAVFAPDSDFLAMGVFRGGPRYVVLAAVSSGRAMILGNFSGSDMYWMP